MSHAAVPAIVSVMTDQTQKTLSHLTVPGAVEFIMVERQAVSAGVAARARN